MKPSEISLARLAAFAAVADAGSFTAAAERLDTTKSALSRSVALLERELGAQLLQRSTRKLAITEAGGAFLADCRALLAEAQSVVERARTGRAQPSGTLRLTSSHASAGQVARWIAAYRLRHPQMRVDYVPSDRTLDLIAERIDVALHIGPMADSTLRAVVLEELEIWTLAAPAYLAQRGTPRKPGDLADHEWVALSALKTPWTVDFTGRGGRRQRVRLRGAISAASNDAVYHLVLHGVGISGFPNVAGVRHEVEAGRLVRLLPGWNAPRMFHYAAYPGNVAPPAKTRAFIDLAKELARSWRATGEPGAASVA